MYLVCYQLQSLHCLLSHITTLCLRYILADIVVCCSAHVHSSMREAAAQAGGAWRCQLGDGVGTRFSNENYIDHRRGVTCLAEGLLWSKSWPQREWVWYRWSADRSATQNATTCGTSQLARFALASVGRLLLWSWNPIRGWTRMLSWRHTTATQFRRGSHRHHNKAQKELISAVITGTVVQCLDPRRRGRLHG